MMGIVLLVVVIVSSISLADATARYVRFFNALTNFKLELGNISFATTQDNLNVTIKLKVSNPTDYGELLLNGIVATAYYEGENHTVVISPGGPRGGSPYQAIETNLWQLPDGYVSPAEPIRVTPYSSDSFSLSIIINDENARAFNDYYESPSRQQDIRWQLNFRVSITTPTFLGTMELQYLLIR